VAAAYLRERSLLESVALIPLRQQESEQLKGLLSATKQECKMLRSQYSSSVTGRVHIKLDELLRDLQATGQR